MPAILTTAFAVYPSVKLKGPKLDRKTGKKKFGVLKELLFGDFVRPYIENGKYVTQAFGERKKQVTYVKVRARGVDGYLKEDQFQAQRVLEVNFVDVGQGDGCHVVTPDDQHFLIDAGPGDNMYRFLKWRFNLARAKAAPPPFTVIVSHSDADHYKGFGKIFTATKGATQQFKIKRIYHNGLVEYGGPSVETLGTVVTHNNRDYVTDLCDSNAAFNSRATKSAKPGLFIATMQKSSAPKSSLRLGSKPIYKKGALLMEILGPVAASIGKKAALPVLDANKGKTKNGHSVVIKLTMGKLRLLLGGDLNTPAEHHLLSRFSGSDIADIKRQLTDKSTAVIKRKALQVELDAAILKSRKTLEVDIAKSCHHGSADFTSEFLRALNPLATVISSGDDEPHTHPRPDTLGTIGKHSRGERSLIFSTELARSGKEFVEYAKLNPKLKKERVVTVYGMINVRTDGEKVVIAQKLERRAPSRDWDIHKLEWDSQNKEFVYRQFEKYA
jgi:beta-lactamase superfamily II metal-dependent hydrolase